jgi:hypothetical protein
MLDLGAKSMETWLGRLPEDVRGVIAGGDAPLPGGADRLAAALSAALATLGGLPADARQACIPEVVRQVPDMVRQHADGTRALGRAGRLRLAAWMAAQGGANPGPALRRLVGETPAGGESGDGTDGGDGAAGADEVGVLFLEDIRAFAKAVVGPRRGRLAVDGQALDIAAEAAFTLESEMAFRQGGV